MERQYWGDLWRYRELFLIFAWRDIVVRYKQTVIGIAWAVIRPLLMMCVFTFVFGRVAQLKGENDIPYALMVYTALLPWQLFSSSLNSIAGSLLMHGNLISKVYFPRILVPAATVGVAVADFFMSCLVLTLLMWWFDFVPSVQIIYVIPLTLLCAGLAFGPGLLFCSLNVKYRDFKIILPFLTQVGLYLSPIGFSSTSVPSGWRGLFLCNPMVGIIDGYRWAVLDSVPFPGLALLITVIVTLVFLYLGISVFRKTEKTFADVI